MRGILGCKRRGGCGDETLKSSELSLRSICGHLPRGRRLKHEPHLVHLMDGLDRQSGHPGAAPGFGHDEPLDTQPRLRLAHRYLAHAELGRYLPLDEECPGREVKVGDRAPKHTVTVVSQRDGG